MTAPKVEPVAASTYATGEPVLPGTTDSHIRPVSDSGNETDGFAKTEKSDDITLKEGDGEREGDGEATDGEGTVAAGDTWKPDYRFWLILMSLVITCIVQGLENTIIVTALPFIVSDLGAGKNYVWIANVHFLTGAAILPTLSKIADLFGRRYITLAVILVYTLGSGLCGGAHNVATLIAGRAMMGAGGSGILMMTEMVIADMVPVRYRGNYVGIVMAVAGLASVAGPSLGGVIVQHTTWRWIFWLNLPVCGVGLVLIYIFLRVKWNRDEPISAKLKRMDVIGNILIVGSSISLLIALTWAGPIYPWNSANVLAPLIIGVIGLCVFVFYESLPSVQEPIMPLHLFATRTGILLYINTFILNSALYWTSFFTPVFFQAVLANEPSTAAALMLPLSAFCVPTIVGATVSLSIWGRYKWLHVFGFALLTLGLGVMSMLNKDMTKAQYVCIQLPGAFGVGFVVGTLLPAFQGLVPEKNQAAATGAWTFIRAFAYVWGVAIAATVFNQYIIRYADDVTDDGARQMLQDGDAFSHATKAFVESYAEPVRTQIQLAYQSAFQKVMQVSIAFAGVGFLLALGEKDIPLRTELETEYGLEERKKKGEEKRPSSVKGDEKAVIAEEV